MKKVYRDMQKEHMRQLKSECQSDARGRDREKKGFVSHCLVKVACEGAAITTDKLRVGDRVGDWNSFPVTKMLR